MKEESFITNSIMNCKMVDIFEKKIPVKFLKQRNFKTQIAFKHEKTNQHIYPIRIIKYFRNNNKDKNIVFFYEHGKITKDESVIVELNNKMDELEMNVDIFMANALYDGLNKNNKFEILFTTMDGKNIYDDINEILVYFISRTDFKKYEDFLEKNYIF